MQALRNAKFITRLVLVWFALFIGAAVASPMVKPTDLQMVCSAAGGMKMVVSDDGGNEVIANSGMDCPLCASGMSPADTGPSAFLKLSPLSHALQPIAAAHIASLTAPPLPSRGPPVSPL
jgi:hypothetical protein